jgi:hypothetical protein
LPTAGEIVLFDRSWYNRAGVERVMGFCNDREYKIFLRQAPLFEEMLIESGFSLTKLWFSVTRSEQRTRFAIRQIDPVRRWKLSPMDIESLDRWDDYTSAKEAMVEHTDTDRAPWTSVKSNDKKRARINAMRFFLSQFEYEARTRPWSSPRTRCSCSAAGTRARTEEARRGGVAESNVVRNHIEGCGYGRLTRWSPWLVEAGLGGIRPSRNEVVDASAPEVSSRFLEGRRSWMPPE